VAEYDEVIPAGQSGKIIATISTKKYQGQLNKSVMVTTNDPQNPKVSLRVRCTIAGIKILPYHRVYMSVTEGVAQTKELKIATIAEDAITVEAISNDPNIQVKLEKLNSNKPADTRDYWEQYILYVTIPENATRKRISGAITLKSDSKYHPKLFINVNTSVINPLIVSPTMLQLSINKKQTSQSKVIQDQPIGWKRPAPDRLGEISVQNA